MAPGPRQGKKQRRGQALAAGLVCGIAAWLGLGALALSGLDGAQVSVGLLPPVWLLALFILLGIALAYAISAASAEAASLLLLPAIAVLPWAGITHPAVLLWSGPIVVLVWTALAIGMARTVSPRWIPARSFMPIHRGPVVFVAAAIALGSVAVLARLPLSGDEPHYLVMSQSLLEDRDVELTNDYDSERYRTFYGGSLEPRHTTFTPAGRHYPIHGLGTSVLVVPGFAIGAASGARATMVLLSALGVALLWAAVRATTESPGAAWAATALLVLQLPFAAQSSQIYPDAPAAVVTCFALWLLCRLERGERVSIAGTALFGAALSTLPWLHIRLSIVAAAFAAGVVLLTLRRRIDVNHLAWFLAAPLIAGALWVASLFVMFETLNPLNTLHHAGSFTSMPSALVGMLTDQEFGLLPFAPGLALAISGLWIRALPITSLAGIAAIAGTVATTASHDWWGGTTSPARFLVPVLPVLAFGAGHWWRTASHALRHVFVMSVAISATLLGMALTAGSRFIVNVPDGRHSLFAWIDDSIDVAALLPSFLTPNRVPATEASIAALWVFSGIAIVFIIGRLRRAAWSHAACGAVIWITLAAALVLMATKRSVTTFDRAQFALLSRSTSPWRSTGIANRRVISRDEVLRLFAFHLPSDDTLTIVRRPQFPPGRYRFELVDRHSPLTAITVRAGRAQEPVWTLGVREGRSESVTLAAPLTTLRITTPDAAQTADVAVRVHPVGLLDSANSFAEPAVFVKAYGPLVVYTQDRLASLEPDGFWLWAGRRTAFVVATREGDQPAVHVALAAGSRPLGVRLARGGWQTDVTLAANVVKEVTVPAAASVEVFSLEVSGERDPHGVWVTVAPR